MATELYISQDEDVQQDEDFHPRSSGGTVS